MFDTKFFSTVLLPLSLAFVMLGMGLNLTRKDFANIFLRPKAIIVGLIAQMVFLPIIALVIALPFPVPVELKVGLILVAICPGGATSNLLNYLLNGNLALCVSLTTINSFLTQLTIPVLLNLTVMGFMHSNATIELNFMETLIHILVITLLPVIIGIIIRQYAENFAEKIRKPMKSVMPILMAIALIGAIILEKKDTEVAISTADYFIVFPMALLLNLGGLFGGFYISKWSKLSHKSAVTISLEVGLQNTSLAIYIATALLGNTNFAIPAVVYALFTFFTSAAFGIWKSKTKISFLSLVTGKKNNQ